jgi:hypothetical protein
MTVDMAPSGRSLSAQVRMVLLEIAREEDDRAADELAAQPYWAACPPSVGGHRAAAAALRHQADRLLTSLASPAARVGEWTA